MNVILKKIPNPNLGRVYRKGVRAFTFPGDPGSPTVGDLEISEDGVEVSVEMLQREFLEVRLLVGLELIRIEDADGNELVLRELLRGSRPEKPEAVAEASPLGVALEERRPKKKEKGKKDEAPKKKEEEPPEDTEEGEVSEPEPSIDVDAVEIEEPSDEGSSADSDVVEEAVPEPIPEVAAPPVAVEEAPKPVEEEAVVEEAPALEEKKPQALTPPKKPLEKMSKKDLVEWFFSNGYEREDLEKMNKPALREFAEEVLGGKS